MHSLTVLDFTWTLKLVLSTCSSADEDSKTISDKPELGLSPPEPAFITIAEAITLLIVHIVKSICMRVF